MEADNVDERGLFLVQDPHLRTTIMPLFAIDKRDLALRPKGRGTTFRINPWRACATAFHVIEELLEPRGASVVLKAHVRLLALQVEGIPYGTPPIRPDQWRSFAKMFVLAGAKTQFGEPAFLRNLTELASIGISRSPNASDLGKFLAMDLRRWHPSIGEQVTAFGFADLDMGDNDADADRPISQYLYGSRATITDIEPADSNRGRPWPFFRVDRDWPGGMSGGPVLNQAGHVVGVVSTGISIAAVGSAVFFSGNYAAAQVFREVDSGAPGHIFCWGGFDKHGQVALIANTRNEFEALPRAADLRGPFLLSYNPETGNYVHVASTQ